MVRHEAPALAAAFSRLVPALGTAAETAVAGSVYEALAPSSLSDDILARRPANLAVLAVTGVEWSDWGSPERVMATLARRGDGMNTGPAGTIPPMVDEIPVTLDDAVAAELNNHPNTTGRI